MTVRVGTRGSALALAQTRTTAAALEAATGEPFEIRVVRTEGDVSTAPLASLGGTGVFAGALRAALLAGECDVVVHSMKDLPVAAAPGLVIAAVPQREDARDALCARLQGSAGGTLETLPAGARVGTGSPRRRAQLAARRPDLQVVDLRGNVDTRLRRVTSGDLDAVVLSLAGLTRLGLTDAVTEVLPLETWPTAAAQGALAVEVREGEADRVALLIDRDSADAVHAERAVLGRLEAGCAAPVAVSSSIWSNGARLWAVVHSVDGAGRIERDRTVDFTDAVDRGTLLHAAAIALADELLAAGAAELAPVGAPR